MRKRIIGAAFADFNSGRAFGDSAAHGQRPTTVVPHCAIAFEHGNGHIIGTSDVRSEELAVTMATNNGCGGIPYSGSPISMSMWMRLGPPAPANSLMEIGTGHQCLDQFRNQYFGEGWGGVWNPVGQLAITDVATDSLTIDQRDASRDYGDFYIDNAFRSTAQILDQPGLDSLDAEVGLESWNQGSVVNGLGTYYTNLAQGTTVSGAFIGWDGFDNHVVVGPEMVGSWVSWTEWHGCQNFFPCRATTRHRGGPL